MRSEAKMEDMQIWREFGEAVFKTLDTGFAEGLDEEFMLADIKDYCAMLNDGERMDAKVEMLWDLWKKNRG
jgi:hypothetical protein